MGNNSIHGCMLVLSIKWSFHYMSRGLKSMLPTDYSSGWGFSCMMTRVDSQLRCFTFPGHVDLSHGFSGKQVSVKLLIYGILLIYWEQPYCKAAPKKRKKQIFPLDSACGIRWRQKYYWDSAFIPSLQVTEDEVNENSARTDPSSHEEELLFCVVVKCHSY